MPQRIPSAVISSEDYPEAALLLGQEGEVETELTVATDGRTSDCTIVRSSGFPALDAATCTAFKARARFKPALDGSGRPTTSKVSQSVTWSIEGNELPVAPWTIRLMVALDKTGSSTNCVIQAGGALKGDETLIDCSDLSGAFTVPPELARRFAGHQTVLIFDQQFVPKLVPSIDTPSDLTRFPLISREVMRINIDSKGRVGNCERTKSEGDYTPVVDGCATLRGRRFKPTARGEMNPVEGTTTTAIYSYVK